MDPAKISKPLTYDSSVTKKSANGWALALHPPKESPPGRHRKLEETRLDYLIRHVLLLLIEHHH